MLARDFDVQEMAEILDLALNVVTDSAIGILIETNLNVKQIAKRLDLEVSQVTPKAVRVLLTRQKREGEIAQQLGVTLAAVRRVTQPKAQKPEAN